MEHLPGAPPIEELFPATCHFRVIGENRHALFMRLEQALAALGFGDVLEVGQVSSGGRYRSFGASIHVDNRAQMRRIDGALREVRGVRMVL